METTSTQPDKEKKGLGRLWKRFKAAFKDKEIPPASPSSTPGPAQVKPAEESAKETPIIPKPQPPTTTVRATTTATTSTEAPMQTDIDRRLTKARELFKKYDFEIDESEWKVDDVRRAKPTERVQKQIRMRVKYTCHSCSTTFGHDRICISCQHPRCNKCVRYPPKKRKGKKTDTAPAAPVEAEALEKKCACHECQTGFDTETEECPNCHHKICERCLKEALVAISPPPATTEPEKKPAPSEQTASSPMPTVAS